MSFQVNDYVMFVKTSDANLDGKIGRVVGYVTKEYPIVLFDVEHGYNPPEGYNPAIMISENCLVEAS